jgi:ParB family transcriptional regulator, chromosome partitioning protein
MPPRKKKTVEPRGLTPKQVAAEKIPAAIEALAEYVSDDGGTVIGSYREPLGGQWQLLAALPIDRVQPTPYQRDLSEAHVKRLAEAIDKLGRFMDPLITVRTEEGMYWTPNGNHRLGAMRALGAKSIVALVVPEQEVAHRILVLNTEKAHNVRERAFEVIRLAEALVELDDRPERSYAVEFEEPSLLTLGCCYQENGRFSGGAYHPILKRMEVFMAQKLSNALAIRRERAAKLLQLDTAVSEAVKGLKARGFDSPYLKAFVLARINPLRFTLKRGQKADFDETIDRMLGSATRFDVGKIRQDQVARAGGPPDE